MVRYVFALNNNTPITFVAHSMGGRMVLHFLHLMPPSWKSKYIRKVITLNTPWGGTVQSIEAVSLGYSFGSSLVDAAKMRIVQRSSPSVMWLMPSEHFWKPNEVLLSTDAKNYSRSNLNELFTYVVFSLYRRTFYRFLNSLFSSHSTETLAFRTGGKWSKILKASKISQHRV